MESGVGAVEWEEGETPKENQHSLPEEKETLLGRQNQQVSLTLQAERAATVPYSALPRYQTLQRVIALQSCVWHSLELCNAVHNLPCILPALPIFPETTGLQLIHYQFLVGGSCRSHLSIMKDPNLWLFLSACSFLLPKERRTRSSEICSTWMIPQISFKPSNRYSLPLFLWKLLLS